MKRLALVGKITKNEKKVQGIIQDRLVYTHVRIKETVDVPATIAEDDTPQVPDFLYRVQEQRKRNKKYGYAL